MDDFLSILLSGVGGGADAYGEQKKYEQRRDDQIKLAQTKASTDLDGDILKTIAGAAAKQAVKGGRTIDFGDLADSPPGTSQTMAIIKKLFQARPATSSKPAIGAGGGLFGATPPKPAASPSIDPAAIAAEIKRRNGGV